jgi:hypothetical protein
MAQKDEEWLTGWPDELVKNSPEVQALFYFQKQYRSFSM